MRKFVIGLDFGTNSLRVLITDTGSGAEIAQATSTYKSGNSGIIGDPNDANTARQNPNDWLIAMEDAVGKALALAEKNKGFQRKYVVGIGVDTTASTPLPIDKNCVPIAFYKEFKNNKNAFAWLWKDHSSFKEAQQITDLAARKFPRYILECGGSYSSEWFFSKIFHCLNTDKRVFDAAYTWVECSDYIPLVLTGVNDAENIKRNICAAGHKAMFNDKWGGFPSSDFFGFLHPKLALFRKRLKGKAYTSDTKAGFLSARWAKKFGLSENVVIASGIIDAHSGAVGLAVKPGRLINIIGTSSCQMTVWPAVKKISDIKGISGIVKGSIIPGYLGIEAGQAAVGDIFNWFMNNCVSENNTHHLLTEKARGLKPGSSGLIALDWHNGNRSVLMDPLLTGLIAGLNLNTKPYEIYRALIEATGFGAKIIIETLEKGKIKIDEIIAGGGIAEKNTLFLQIYSDILNRPIRISESSQSCALGACIYAAVSAGVYKKVEDAQEKMCSKNRIACRPNQKNSALYKPLFEIYKEMHDAFGRGMSFKDPKNIMKRLIKIRSLSARERN